MLKQLQPPIIIVEDSNYGNISTTINDVLTQVELLRYSTNLKGVDLDQFMEMTDEKDFKLFGIHKQRDCRKLSKIAQSIRRSSSLSSSSLSSFSQSEDSKDDLEYADKENSFLSPSFTRQQQDEDTKPYLTLDGNEDGEDELKAVQSVLQKIRLIAAATANLDAGGEKIKESKKKKKVQFAADPPKYGDTTRRFSLPSLNPPKYCDHILDTTRRNSHAGDRNSAPPKPQTEDKELLPEYSCSVQKMGKAFVKIEFDFPGVRPKRRPWRDVYMELQGTVLKIYEAKNTSPSLGGYRYLPTMAPVYQESAKYTPLINISLSNTKVEAATDYTKKPNVFRIKTESGPQVLFHVQTWAAMLLWTEKISAGINVAVDLESQSMPPLNTAIAFEHPATQK